ncbi:hypothetical protein D9M68_794550 [compost metagenome]
MLASFTLISGASPSSGAASVAGASAGASDGTDRVSETGGAGGGDFFFLGLACLGSFGCMGSASAPPSPATRNSTWLPSRPMLIEVGRGRSPWG